MPATCLAPIGTTVAGLDPSRVDVGAPGHVYTTELPIRAHRIEVLATHPYAEQSFMAYVAKDDISRVEVMLQP